MSKKLYLIPTTLGEDQEIFLFPSAAASIQDLRTFWVEEEKSARKFLKKAVPSISLSECTLLPLNEHTSRREIEENFRKAGEQDMGIISEAGCPCVADPGAEVVALAHQHGWQVIPLVGPSSILLALMASGLNGQRFTFHGYLPKEKDQRLKKIKAMEQTSIREQQTQIFMETPYRNEALFADVLAACNPSTRLCVAADLLLPGQWVKTMPIQEWKKHASPTLHKRPTLFLMEGRP